MDELNKDEEQTQQEEKKTSILSTPMKWVSKNIKAGIDFIETNINKVEVSYNEHKHQEELNALFVKEATPFMNKECRYVYGVKDTTAKTILFRKSDTVLCKQVFSYCNQDYEITDGDFNTFIDYHIGDGTVCCYKVHYDFYVKQPTPIVPVQNIEQTIIGSTINGDVSISLQINNNLRTLEDGIRTAKVTILNKGKQQDAINLFGQFKDCIINKKKDQSLFNSFVKVLGAVAPALVTLAASLFASI